MLKHSFIHIPHVGIKTERMLWRNGMLSWDDVLGSQAQAVIREPLLSRLRSYLLESQKQLHARNARYFAERLPSSEQWRLFFDFQNETGYFDIETTGMGGEYDHITCLALYHHGQVRTYVYGQNLETFLDDVLGCKVLVTYNGKCFDVPFLERQFRTRIGHAHIDLRYVLKSLGYSGGLKGCERQMGIHRHELDGVDGYFAVLLWKEYRQCKNNNALETLLAYNVEDTVNLEKLMIAAYNKKLANTPFSGEMIDGTDRDVEKPYYAHVPTVEALRRQYYAT